MKWILSAGKDIVVDNSQLKARTKYICQVTETDVSNWELVEVNGLRFLFCESKDFVDGVFITAHIGDVYTLSTMHQVYESRIIIANTCIYGKSWHKNLLHRLYQSNPDIELFFAKQELSIEPGRILRQTTTLHKVGQFGFQTSSSERELFMNRRKGFEEALKISFERVSPILLTSTAFPK